MIKQKMTRRPFYNWGILAILILLAVIVIYFYTKIPHMPKNRLRADSLTYLIKALILIAVK